jgi:hypothetical protein
VKPGPNDPKTSKKKLQRHGPDEGVKSPGPVRGRRFRATACRLRRPHGMTTTFALDEAAARGDYHAFRKLLFAAESRLLRRAARRRLDSDEAREAVDCALELAFRGFDERPTELTLDDWLDRLLDAAIRTRREGGDGHA